MTVSAACAAAGANLGLHALGAARRSMRAVLITAVLIVVSAIVGALVAGAEGTLYFSAGAAWVGNGLCWWQLRAALQETPRVRVPVWLWPSSGRHQVTAGEQA